MNARSLPVLILLPIALSAQLAQDVAPLKQWPAPLYWQSAGAETRGVAGREARPESVGKTASAGSHVNLTFVAMTPMNACPASKEILGARYGFRDQLALFLSNDRDQDMGRRNNE